MPFRPTATTCRRSATAVEVAVGVASPSSTNSRPNLAEGTSCAVCVVARFVLPRKPAVICVDISVLLYIDMPKICVEQSTNLCCLGIDNIVSKCSRWHARPANTTIADLMHNRTAGSRHTRASLLKPVIYSFLTSLYDNNNNHHHPIYIAPC